MDPKQGAKICKCCGQEIKRNPYESYGATNLLIQTPKSVWAHYRADGYTIAEALREEWSYA